MLPRHFLKECKRNERSMHGFLMFASKMVIREVQYLGHQNFSPILSPPPQPITTLPTRSHPPPIPPNDIPSHTPPCTPRPTTIHPSIHPNDFPSPHPTSNTNILYPRNRHHLPHRRLFPRASFISRYLLLLILLPLNHQEEKEKWEEWERKLAE